MRYPIVPIGELVTLRQGFAINKNTKHHMSDVPTTLHLLRIGDMKEGTFSVFVKDTIPSHFIATEKDIIYTRTGQVGLVFRNQYGVIHNNCFTVTPKDDLQLARNYLYYVLRSKDFYDEANAKASGAAQPDLPHGAFNSIYIPFPPISKQNKIASVLSTYDNLIENNQKQIKLLEEAAQRLYKEWFIDLRFPGHESTPIRDGIPEGWERKSVEECLQMHINGGWGKESPEAKNCIPGRVIRGTDINDVKAGNLNDIPLRYHTENDVRKRALRQGDIIFELSNGNLANIGRTLFVDDLLLQYCGNPTICASFCKLFRPVDRLHALMLYWEIQDMQTSGRMLPYKKHGANGINNFDFEGLLNHMLLVPMSLEFVTPFDLVMQKESVIQHELMLLAEARDRLLPKLMSGEMEV